MPGEPAARAAHVPDVPVTADWFDAPLCRNCGASLGTAYCSQCGQKAAKRLVWRDLGKETWERLRLFELRSARTVWRLVRSPGTVARQYVMGRRKANMHPLTLLVALIAFLSVLLAANHYFNVNGFGQHDRDLDRVTQRVLSYANWSFSLGIFAIFIGSWTVFRRRLGYNFIEHAVLAIYCQSFILAISIVSLLPTMIRRDPGFVMAHKNAAEYYLPVLKTAIVALAYKQFFLLRLRTDWPGLALACLVYAGSAWLLLRLYAAAILWLVMG